jgi:hypothetical protein
MRLLAFLLFLLLSAPASAHVIHEDLGGPIDAYQDILKHTLETHEPVAIDGECTSACTIIALGLPREQVCVTPNAKLGFHNAYIAHEDEDGNVTPNARDATGFPVRTDEGTKALIANYPHDIMAWIAMNGGLHPWVLYLRMPELGKFMRPCS